MVSTHLLEAIRCCADNGAHSIVVDLAEVTFMDSSGIAALIDGHKALEAMGRTMVVQNIPKAIRLTFQMTGVMDYFNIGQPVSEASGF